MRFEDSSIDLSGVEDRGGYGGGFGGSSFGGGSGIAFGGGGLSVAGLVLYLVFNLLAGGGGEVGVGGLPSGTSAGSRGSSAGELRERCSRPGALEQDTQCRLIKVYNVADEVWREEFARRGLAYERPRLAFFTGGTRTSCGSATSSVGPFYCPADQGIYFDVEFLERLQRQLGAPGEFAQAYIVAHEFGHHLQTILGTERRVRLAQRKFRGSENSFSVAMELQADCYAGVWSRVVAQSGEDDIIIEKQDIPAALNAAEAVGDDRGQQQSGGTVDQESFTHGSSAERRAWFTRGFETGRMEGCDTFTERGLSL